MSTDIVLIAALVLALAALASSLVLSRRHHAQQVRLDAMQSDLRALCNAMMSLAQRQGLVEQQLRQIAARQEELGLRQQQHDDPDARSYEQADKLLRKGASAEELVEICGISRGEAELLVMMRRLDGGTS
ncbi:MAG: DUF2802 domain-containing protein [Gammaproteobacteria bacterium]|nr:DUF2802 domain-containing protein [Gammaproteobacteria bacterium]